MEDHSEHIPFKPTQGSMLCLLLLLTSSCRRIQAQVWTLINCLPVTEAMKTVKFIDLNTGWTAGESGTILKTTNGGMTWFVQTFGITNTIRSIFFLDANNGWACGVEGTIIATTNGGTTWTPQSSPYTTQYNSIRFADFNNGWQVGCSETIRHTIDPGAIDTNGFAGNGICHIFMDSLQAHSYLWTHMAGGGSDTSYRNTSEGIFVAKPVASTFIFSGDGAWSTQRHWTNSLKPPALLLAGHSIVIDPVTGGECMLDIMQHFATGANLILIPGVKFVLTEDLFIH